MGSGRPPAWRTVAAAAVSLCALPVVLFLALLWMPLLCCAVAVLRFRRVKRRRMLQGCRAGGSRGTVDAGDRLRLLQKYLEDQMELVGGAEAGELLDDPREA